MTFISLNLLLNVYNQEMKSFQRKNPNLSDPTAGSQTCLSAFYRPCEMGGALESTLGGIFHDRSVRSGLAALGRVLWVGSHLGVKGGGRARQLYSRRDLRRS